MTHDTLHDGIIPDLKRILAPTDFSAPSKLALAHACRLARESGAGVFVLHVSNDLHIPRGCSASEYLESRDRVRRKVREELDEFLTPLCGKDLADRLHFLASEGVPDTEILREAAERDVDLIVISTHGHTGFQRFLLGSTAEKVVRQAPCSVLVIREKHPTPVSSTEIAGVTRSPMESGESVPAKT